jgi:transcription elongation factor Elf1
MEVGWAGNKRAIRHKRLLKKIPQRRGVHFRCLCGIEIEADDESVAKHGRLTDIYCGSCTRRWQIDDEMKAAYFFTLKK